MKNSRIEEEDGCEAGNKEKKEGMEKRVMTIRGKSEGLRCQVREKKRMAEAGGMEGKK